MDKNQYTRQPHSPDAAGANQTGRPSAPDGTREYRLHSRGAAHPQRAADPGAPEPWTPTGTGALNADVFQGLQEQAFYPGLALSGEVPRTGKDGRPREEDSVVRNQVKEREAFPYG